MKRNLLIYSVSAVVLSTLIHATPTFANPIGSLNSESQIKSTQEQIGDLETKIQRLDDKIIVAMDKSEKLSNDIKAQQEQIKETNTEIEKARNQFLTHKKIYSERLRSIQSQGQQPVVAYAELLFSSNSISEFLNRSVTITEFVQSDTDLLEGLNEKEQTLKNAEQKLDNELDNLKNKQDELISEQKKIESDKQQIVKELAESKNTLQQQIAEQEVQQKEAQQESSVLQQQIAEQEVQQKVSQQQSSINHVSLPTQTANVVNIPSSDSGKANQVIAYAEQFLGVPYVWGGTSTSGFDCSGLMQYVFRSVGVNLPRVSSAQQQAGIKISPSQVQPGDLVFQGMPAYHVGMYIGGGKWLHAPQTGDVVKIASYNPSKFSSAARVLK